MTSSPSKVQVIIGWILTVLMFLMLSVVSASGKFVEWEGKAEMFGKMGFRSLYCISFHTLHFSARSC